MSPTNGFTVHVVFTGLILFVRKEGIITHALLREARVSSGGGGAHSHDHHTPCLAWKGGGKKELDRVRLSLQWMKGGTVINAPLGAAPVGPERVGKFPSFLANAENVKDDQSFAWVPHFRRMGPNNRVAPNCLSQSRVSSRVVAQVLLHGGSIRTGQFAWGEEEVLESTPVAALGRESNQEGGIRKWIPALLYKRNDGEAGPTDQAAAEAVVWDVPAPAGATSLRISCIDLDARRSAEPCDGLPPAVQIGAEGELWLTIANSPAKLPENHGKANSGRRPNAQAVHFDQLYDLLDGAVANRERRMPKLPGAFRDSGGLQSVIPDRKPNPPLEFFDCDCDLTKGLLNRPLCVPGSADG